MRSLVFIVTVAGAYLLLRGHPERMPVLLRACVAVLALVAGLGFWGRRIRPDEGAATSRRPTGWLDYLAIGMAVLAIECGFVLFFSAVPPPLEAVAARLEAWWRPAAAAEREDAADGRANAGGNWLWNDHRQRPLPRRTNLKPGNRPEVFLRPGDGAAASRMLGSRIYVGAFALDRYSAGVWSTGGGEHELLTAGPDGWLRLGDRSGGESIGCEVFHATNRPAGHPLTALQGVVAVETAELTRLGDGLHLLPTPDEDGYQYRTVSKPLVLDDLSRGGRAAEAAAKEWLELPAGAPGERIAGLARLAAGEGPVVDQLLRLRGHLRTTLGYSLKTENAKDLDPLENFLFEEQKGHCEFFATAGALLARSLGVPSRVAYGWAGGTYYEGSNLFVFRAREAHAWTEVLMEGHGWTVLDATPPGALERELAATAPPEEQPPGVGELAADEDPATPGQEDGLKAPLLLAAGFALPALLLVAWRARRAGAVAGDRGEAEREVAGYLAAFRRACQRHGHPLGGSRTLRTCLRGMPDAPDFATDLQAYHYAVRYEGKPADPAIERRLRRAAERWK